MTLFIEFIYIVVCICIKNILCLDLDSRGKQISASHFSSVCYNIVVCIDRENKKIESPTNKSTIYTEVLYIRKIKIKSYKDGSHCIHLGSCLDLTS